MNIDMKTTKKIIVGLILCMVSFVCMVQYHLFKNNFEPPQNHNSYVQPTTFQTEAAPGEIDGPPKAHSALRRSIKDNIASLGVTKINGQPFYETTKDVKNVPQNGTDVWNTLEDDWDEWQSDESEYIDPNQNTAKPQASYNSAEETQDDITLDETSNVFTPDETPNVITQEETPNVITQDETPNVTSDETPIKVHYKLPSTGKHKDDGSWLIIKNTFRNVSLFNIFWDNRPDVESGPVLRVLGISDIGKMFIRHEEPRYFIGCFISCEAEGAVHRVPYDDPQSEKIYMQREVSGVMYERHVFTCLLDQAPCQVPHRAVIRIGSSENITRPEHLDSGNSILVEYPVQRVEVQQQIIGVCGPILYGFIDPYRLIEWLEMLKLLGVQKIVLYDRDLEEGIDNILQAYQDKDLVELRNIEQEGVVPMPKDEYRADIYTIGPVTLSDCMYRNMFQFEWLVTLDLDELILPRNHLTYSELLTDLEKVPKNKVRVGYKFLHVDFILDPVLDPQPDEKVPKQMLMVRHRRRFGVQSKIYHAKSIIRPERCTALHYHVCRGYMPNIGLAPAVSPELGLDCHYRQGLCPEKVRIYKQCLGMLNFGKPLMDTIALRYKNGLRKAMLSQIKILGLDSFD